MHILVAVSIKRHNCSNRVIFGAKRNKWFYIKRFVYSSCGVLLRLWKQFHNVSCGSVWENDHAVQIGGVESERLRHLPDRKGITKDDIKLHNGKCIFQCNIHIISGIKCGLLSSLCHHIMSCPISLCEKPHHTVFKLIRIVELLFHCYIHKHNPPCWL